MTDLTYRECCGVYSANEEHTCVPYDESHPCPKCGAPSVFAFVGAPGTGSGWVCKNNHFDGTVRELTLAEVI